MRPLDKNLLIRVARRLEEQAEEAHTRALAGSDPKTIEQAKRRRDRELGDARDVRDYVKRIEAEHGAKTEPAHG